MSKRVRFSSIINEELRDKLIQLSEETRIPQSKLLDEALEDLFKKYEKK